MAAWSRCSSLRKHSSLQVPLQALRRFSHYLQLIFPSEMNLLAALFFLTPKIQFEFYLFNVKNICFVLLFVTRVYKNHGAWHWELALFLECESWGFPFCTYLSNKFLLQKAFEKPHMGKLPWTPKKNCSFLFMSYCKGGIGLIKAVSALFIHKYLHEEILPQVKSIPQKHTGFPVYSKEVVCSFPRQQWILNILN